jgi:hypothetical protein
MSLTRDQVVQWQTDIKWRKGISEPGRLPGGQIAWPPESIRVPGNLRIRSDCRGDTPFHLWHPAAPETGPAARIQCGKCAGAAIPQLSCQTSLASVPQPVIPERPNRLNVCREPLPTRDAALQGRSQVRRGWAPTDCSPGPSLCHSIRVLVVRRETCGIENTHSGLSAESLGKESLEAASRPRVIPQQE